MRRTQLVRHAIALAIRSVRVAAVRCSSSPFAAAVLAFEVGALVVTLSSAAWRR
jgi:hypothetical protein